MSIPDVPHSREVEGSGFQYEAYRAFVDTNTIGSRKLGLLDQAMAEEAIRDPSTVVREYVGNQIPILAHLKYAAGYDYTKCKEMAEAGDDNNLYYLSVIPKVFTNNSEEVQNNIKDQLKPGDVLFFEYASNDSEAKAITDEILQKLERPISEVTALVDEQGKQASMGLFLADVVNHSPYNRHPLKDMTPVDAFNTRLERGEAELEPVNGPTLLLSDNIDEVLFEKLWKLYEKRFEWLGENHPISMQDTRDDFESHLRSPHTVTSVFYEQGEPVCLAYFMDNTDEVYWLNSNFLRSHLANTDEQPLMFFGGIASSAEHAGLSRQVIQYICAFLNDTGKNYQVMFESTNRSEMYIPNMVEKYVNETGLLTSEHPRKIDDHIYRAVRVD